MTFRQTYKSLGGCYCSAFPEAQERSTAPSFVIYRVPLQKNQHHASTVHLSYTYMHILHCIGTETVIKMVVSFGWWQIHSAPGNQRFRKSWHYFVCQEYREIDSLIPGPMHIPCSNTIFYTYSHHAQLERKLVGHFQWAVLSMQTSVHRMGNSKISEAMKRYNQPC